MYKHHGLPHSIVSDRDKVFLSNLWKELFRLADVQLRMSSAYHPQSDGQTERVNQCLDVWRRSFVVLSMPALINGVSGYQLHNSGITRLHIQLREGRHLKCSMGVALDSLVFQILLSLLPLIYLYGCRTGRSCLI